MRPNPFATAVAIYPYCVHQVARLDAPLLILIGAADDWTHADRCKQMKVIGPPEGTRPHELTLKIYLYAHHGFDVPGVDFEAMGHTMKYDPVAAQNAVQQVRRFLAKHLNKMCAFNRRCAAASGCRRGRHG